MAMLDPAIVLASAVASLSHDLALGDAPQVSSPYEPDPRLGALLASIVARLAEDHRNNSEVVYQLLETTALDDFIEYLEETADKHLSLPDR